MQVNEVDVDQDGIIEFPELLNLMVCNMKELFETWMKTGIETAY